MNNEFVQVCVDDGTIAAGDPWEVMEPVLWSANIYDGPEQYEISLSGFSIPQRLVYALMWYRIEVNNGGHDQFYFNSTGIVWKDALNAFEALELPEFANILRGSTERLGGSPSLDRQARNEQLESIEPDFDDLDEAFYEAEKRMDLDHRIMSFIRARPSAFYFVGEVRKPAD
ncbi:MAG: DMP19 family protein [Nitrospira sp.]|nr:DMP19 family protein [Nitrospira sp.]